MILSSDSIEIPKEVRSVCSFCYGFHEDEGDYVFSCRDLHFLKTQLIYQFFFTCQCQCRINDRFVLTLYACRRMFWQPLSLQSLGSMSQTSLAVARHAAGNPVCKAAIAAKGRAGCMKRPNEQKCCNRLNDDC